MRAAKKLAGFGREMPPVKEHITIYFIQKGLTEKEANIFFQQHEQSGWHTKRGKAIRNWKAVAAEWIWEYQQLQKSKYSVNQSQVKR